MIYFSLNYVVLCTRPSRPRPQLYDMDGRYHSQWVGIGHCGSGGHGWLWWGLRKRVEG
jgi:hypothetical protein